MITAAHIIDPGAHARHQVDSRNHLPSRSHRALALTRLMACSLFGLTATAPATFAAVALLLILIALAATYMPARRATQVDPLAVLRCE